jgi:DNA-binding LytR/AlgR family response regulator
MSARRPSGMIADDEPLLRDSLERMLSQAWPELEITARARNGREAVALFESLKPDVCFLDVHMPGLSGVEAARHIAGRAHLVFVTAFDQYAVQAFEHRALDYLVKPVEAERLADTVRRLKTRLGEDQPPAAGEALHCLRVTVGQALRLVWVDEIDFLRSEEKYTVVAWRGEGGKPSEALIRTPLKDIVEQLDAVHFVQVHRSVVVNLRSISQVVRSANETASIHLKGRPEVLPVSRSYLHLFRQM